VGGTPVPVLAPHSGLVDTTRHQRLHGSADTLAFADEFEERCRIRAADACRIESARRRFQSINSAANSLEHASSRA
jgi:hypothetical protein